MIIVIQKWLKKDKGILSHNHAEKCMKVPFVAYADTESSLEKIHIVHINCSYSLYTYCSFDNTKNRHNY